MNRCLLVSMCCLVPACNAGYTITGNSDATAQDASGLDAVVQDAVVANDASLVSDSAVGDAAVPQDTLWAYCGDGVLNGNEQCDGQDTGVLTCGTFGFVHGVLLCNAACAVDTSGCSNTTVCGDGIAEGTEECDQADFKGVWCGDLQGFVAGQLVCTASCTVSTSLCLVSVCGDEVTTQPYEQCDGPDLGGLTCQGLGFDGGTLGCAGDCTPDTAGCTMDPFCGDEIVDPGEACDEGDPSVQAEVDITCEDIGMQSRPGGSVITCWQCQLNTYSCIAASTCGNNIMEYGEECDGQASAPTCMFDPSQHGVCSTGCTLDCSSCPGGVCN